MRLRSKFRGTVPEFRTDEGAIDWFRIGGDMTAAVASRRSDKAARFRGSKCTSMSTKDHFRRYPLDALPGAKLDLRIHNEGAPEDLQRSLKIAAAFPEQGWHWNVSTGEYRPMTDVERIENGLDSLPKGKMIEDRELISSTAERDFRAARITLSQYKGALRQSSNRFYATHICR